MKGKATGIAVFLSITFGFSWLSWLVIYLAGISSRSPWFQLAIIPSGFSPALAAILVRKWVTREGFADAGLKLNFKQSWRLYLFAWLLPVAVVAFVALLGWGLGLGNPDLLSGLQKLVPAAEMPANLSNWLIFPILLQMMITTLIATPILWGEEFGWRSYLQLRLLGDKPLIAAIVTGLIWAVWHYPLILMGYQYPDHRLVGIPVFTVSVVLLSIVFGWLRLRSGSIWPVSLAHAGTNIIGQILMMLFAGGANFIFFSYLGILGWLPLGGVCAWIVVTGRMKQATLSQ